MTNQTHLLLSMRHQRFAAAADALCRCLSCGSVAVWRGPSPDVAKKVNILKAVIQTGGQARDRAVNRTGMFGHSN